MFLLSGHVRFLLLRPDVTPAPLHLFSRYPNQRSARGAKKVIKIITNFNRHYLHFNDDSIYFNQDSFFSNEL
jgi:hypothetical protein